MNGSVSAKKHCGKGARGLAGDGGEPGVRTLSLELQPKLQTQGRFSSEFRLVADSLDKQFGRLGGLEAMCVLGFEGKGTGNGIVPFKRPLRYEFETSGKPQLNVRRGRH